jgi:hypothetical protein
VTGPADTGTPVADTDTSSWDELVSLLEAFDHWPWPKEPEEGER